MALLVVYGLWQIGDLFVYRYLTRPNDIDSYIQTEPEKPNAADSSNAVSDKSDNTDKTPESIQEGTKEKSQKYGMTVKEEEKNPDEKVQELNSVRTQIMYQTLYPELRNDQPVIRERKSKTVYLTFDDGPSARTAEILDILKERNIKATFFVVSENNNLDILKRVAEEGHTIGIHSHSHKYKEIYKSVEAFLDDFNTCYNKIYEAASVKPQVFRFPGGSINAYNRGIYQDIISEMLRRGFLYYDWNISNQDTDKNADKAKVIESVKEGFANQDSIIVLCHDNLNKRHTVEALPEIIDFFEEKGYTFEKLDNSVEPIVFTYPD